MTDAQRSSEPKNCREVGPGEGLCVECANGHYERCLYVARAKRQPSSKELGIYLGKDRDELRELLYERDAEIAQLTYDLQVQKGVVDMAYIPHRHLVEQRDRADHEFKNFHRQLCERFGYGHDERDWRRDQVSLIEWIAKRPPAETSAGGWTVEEYRNGVWQRCAMGQAWQTNADAHQQCRELQERYPNRVFGVTTLKAPAVPDMCTCPYNSAITSLIVDPLCPVHALNGAGV